MSIPTNSRMDWSWYLAAEIGMGKVEGGRGKPPKGESAGNIPIFGYKK